MKNISTPRRIVPSHGRSRFRALLEEFDDAVGSLGDSEPSGDGAGADTGRLRAA
jgi:hypothetical protein